ncbi:hypothetical protein EJ04DRAFT_365528, partial [Polyplosphaeria fusca]
MGLSAEIQLRVGACYLWREQNWAAWPLAWREKRNARCGAGYMMMGPREDCYTVVILLVGYGRHHKQALVRLPVLGRQNRARTLSDLKLTGSRQ